MIKNDFIQELEAQRILKEKAKLKPDDFYWNDNGQMVFTEQYHLRRGRCCNNSCKNCPYKDEGDEYRERNFENYED